MERLKKTKTAAKEYDLLCSFDSPRIIRPKGVREDCLVLPYYKERAADGIAGYCTEREAWRFLHDVSEGLAYIHSKGLIHMDIKPSNILIDRNGYVITDFDMEYDEDSHAFNPPEWDKNRRNLSKKSDIWSLGASAFNLIMGVKIFNGYGGRAQQKETPVPSLRSDRYSHELISLLNRCLDWNPDKRPDAEEIVATADRMLMKKSRVKEKPITLGKECHPYDKVWPEDITDTGII